jgi:hypothetical protein
MDFASKFAYLATNVEEVDDEELSTPLQQQQQQIRAVNTLSAPPPPSSGGSWSFSGGGGSSSQPTSQEKKSRRRARFQRQIDTNIITIPLGRLKDTVDLATGDCEFCNNCKAALSVFSKLYDHEGNLVHPKPLKMVTETKTELQTKISIPKGETIEEGQQLWTCEFCGTHNVLDLEEPEFPQKNQLDFLLTPAPVTLGTTSTNSDSSETSLIFVCDVSGSMCVTQEIQGKVKLKGQPNQPDLSQFMEHNQGGHMASQFLPGQNQNTTYVSRLQAMQAALSSQIDMIARVYPQKRIGVVTFASDVVIYGDGTSDPVVLAGDRLSDFEHLIAAGASANVKKAVSETKDELEKRIWDLSESGATALGPAMVVAVSAAAQKTGSSVTLCTDGLANVGLGSLEEIDSNEDKEKKADAFYTRIGQYALDKGVTINVTGIEGCGCDVEHLGVMSDITEGEVEKVAPMDLAKNFATALENPVVATKTQVKMFLHRGLTFRDTETVVDTNEKNDGENGKKQTNETFMVRDIGNVTEDTDTSFEFNARPAKQLKELGCANIKELPFQVQITYQRLDGSTYVRIITNVQKTTKEIEIANKYADYSMMASHAEQSCSRMAKRGDYTGSKGAARGWNKFFSKHEATPQQRQVSSLFMDNMVEMDEALENTMMLEKSSATFSKSAKNKESLSMFRRKARSKNDGLSSMLSKKSKKSKRGIYMKAARTPMSNSQSNPPKAPSKSTLTKVNEESKLEPSDSDSNSGGGGGGGDK